MSENKTWSTAEDEKLIHFVKLYPSNLSFAFYKASNTLRTRSIKACNRRYYRTLRQEYPNLIATGSSYGIIFNTKISKRPADNKTKIAAMNLFSKLTYKEKQEVLENIF